MDRLALPAAAVLLACGDDLSPRVPAAIVVTPVAPRVFIAVTDENGDIVPDAEPVIHTDNAAVASVSPGGNVWARQSGLTLITITSGEHYRDVAVSVTP
jgi:hypothetical protein